MEQSNIVSRLKTSAFKAFVSFIKPLWGKGLGRIPPVGAIYKRLYRSLAVNEINLNVHGLKMIIRTSDLDGISHELLFRSAYEQCEVKLFEQSVTQDMTVVDIGANIGYYTLLAAGRVGGKGKVFAFEPELENYALLVRNIELNGYGNVTPVMKAVSSKTGTADLFLNRETGAHCFLPEREGIVGVATVETTSLDEFFKDSEQPIDVIKIDVEGSELAVLAGMQNIIKCNDNLRIFTEFWPWGLQKCGFSPQEYWGKLVESGFPFIYLINEHESRLRLTDFASVMRYCEDTSMSKLPSANLLCTKIPLKVSRY